VKAKYAVFVIRVNTCVQLTNSMRQDFQKLTVPQLVKKDHSNLLKHVLRLVLEINVSVLAMSITQFKGLRALRKELASLGPGKSHKIEGQTLCVAICNNRPTRCSRKSVLSLHYYHYITS